MAEGGLKVGKGISEQERLEQHRSHLREGMELARLCPLCPNPPPNPADVTLSCSEIQVALQLTGVFLNIGGEIAPYPKETFGCLLNCAGYSIDHVVWVHHSRLES